MTLDLNKLEQLLTVGRTGNFTKAARDLGLTQPALSRNIALVEERYGLKVFDRGRGGAHPTTIGRQILEEVEHLLRLASSVEHNLQLYGHGEGGRMSVGIGPQIAGLVLPRLGARMLDANPQLRIDYSLKTVDVLMPELRDGRLEMIICASGHVAPSAELAIERLGSMRLGFLTRAGHPLAGAREVAMADLAPFPVALESAILPPAFPRYPRGVSCENSQVLRDVVLASDAVWFSAPSIVQADIASKAIVEIDVGDLPLRSVEVGAIRLAQRRCAPSVSKIMDIVREVLGSVG